ncbi:MAG: hypothetical protein K2X32_03740 [Phycisphaerales bacterium]|nr:hypothetical protein [Phycisphaerales bacterium]
MEIATTPSTNIAQHLIAELLQSDHSIPEIAEAFSLSFTEFVRILESPAAQAELAALTKLAELREALRNPKRREIALARLATIAESEPDNRESRRAATTLLRNLKAPRARATDPSSGRCEKPGVAVSTAPTDDGDHPTVAPSDPRNTPPRDIENTLAPSPTVAEHPSSRDRPSIARRSRRRSPHETDEACFAICEGAGAGAPHSGQTDPGVKPRRS